MMRCYDCEKVSHLKMDYEKGAEMDKGSKDWGG